MFNIKELGLHRLLCKKLQAGSELLIHFRKPPLPQVVSIDYESGTVEFDRKPRGEVTATFRYEKSE